MEKIKEEISGYPFLKHRWNPKKEQPEYYEIYQIFCFSYFDSRDDICTNLLTNKVKLEKLRLTNFVNSDNFDALLIDLKKLDSLVEVDLSKHKFIGQKVDNLIDALKDKGVKDFFQLRLEKCGLTDAGAIKLLNLLYRNEHISIVGEGIGSRMLDEGTGDAFCNLDKLNFQASQNSLLDALEDVLVSYSSRFFDRINGWFEIFLIFTVNNYQGCFSTNHRPESTILSWFYILFLVYDEKSDESFITPNNIPERYFRLLWILERNRNMILY